MPLRPARPDDAAVIVELIRELADYERLSHLAVITEDDLRRDLFGDDVHTYVTLAETDDGTTAGFALWFHTYSTFLGRSGIWLEDLFVRPPYRGSGFGRALLDDLRRRTDGRVEWSVLDWNTPSIEFYDALGARPLTEWITYRWDPPDEPDQSSTMPRNPSAP